MPVANPISAESERKYIFMSRSHPGEQLSCQKLISSSRLQIDSQGRRSHRATNATRSSAGKRNGKVADASSPAPTSFFCVWLFSFFLFVCVCVVMFLSQQAFLKKNKKNKKHTHINTHSLPRPKERRNLVAYLSVGRLSCVDGSSRYQRNNNRGRDA